MKIIISVLVRSIGLAMCGIPIYGFITSSMKYGFLDATRSTEPFSWVLGIGFLSIPGFLVAIFGPAFGEEAWENRIGGLQTMLGGLGIAAFGVLIGWIGLLMGFLVLAYGVVAVGGVMTILGFSIFLTGRLPPSDESEESGFHPPSSETSVESDGQSKLDNGVTASDTTIEPGSLSNSAKTQKWLSE